MSSGWPPCPARSSYGLICARAAKECMSRKACACPVKLLRGAIQSVGPSAVPASYSASKTIFPAPAHRRVRVSALAARFLRVPCSALNISGAMFTQPSHRAANSPTPASIALELRHLRRRPPVTGIDAGHGRIRPNNRSLHKPGEGRLGHRSEPVLHGVTHCPRLDLIQPRAAHGRTSPSQGWSGSRSRARRTSGSIAYGASTCSPATGGKRCRD